MNKSGNNISDLLFKPLLMSTEEGPKLVLIYSYGTSTEHVMDSKGELLKQKKEVVKYLDVYKSIDINMAYIQTVVIQDKKTLRELVEELDVEECFNEVLMATTLVVEEITSLHERQAEMTNLLAAIRKASNPMRENLLPNQGNLVVAGSSEPLTNIVFKTISGEKVDIKKALKPEDVRKIGEVLLEIVQSHTDSDIESEEFLEKLRHEVEYKVVESLPAHLKAGDIDVNLNAFIQEIKRFREESE